MLFPKEKMQVITSYQGKTSEDGWLVLDLARVDTEGADKIYIDLGHVNQLQKNKAEQSNLLKKARDLLSLDDDQE